MLRRLALRDFVIVDELDVELGAGFTVLTGETGAGKSILVDALQLALGGRGDAGVVREGAQRSEITAEFDSPPALAGWLAEAGFEADDDSLLLRRSLDAQGRSRAWINGSAATVAQLREAAEHLVDIHGQHAWQSLTRPAAVRALLDAQAGVDAGALAQRWQQWKAADDALEQARTRQADLQRERERLAWQIGELDRLQPGADEWTGLDAEHRRLAHGQALIDAAQAALAAIDEAERNAAVLTSRAADALEAVADHDARLAPVAEVLRGAEAALQDAAHSLNGYLHQVEPDPQRLAAVETRLSDWMALARRWRRPPAELPALLAQWRAELAALDAAADLATLEQAGAAAAAALREEAQRASRLRAKAAPRLAEAVTAAMQQLGMAGGRFDVALQPLDEPQSHGLETTEFLIAGHAGSTPRALAKVASGGELSRLALAIAVTTARQDGAGAATLIFDEIDAGVGGTVADAVGRLMQQLGRERQVLAVTHLPQVAACADHHLVVAKQTAADGSTRSGLQPVTGVDRVGEIARMLGGGERLSGASRAHAQALLTEAAGPTSRRSKA